MQPGLPERQTHDYHRHGTTTLFAALRVLYGVVIGECHARQRAREPVQCLRRLDGDTDQTLALHLILDNASAHTSAATKRWLARHPRVHVHFTPTSSSWLNLVERWFAEITRERIRRGTFDGGPGVRRHRLTHGATAIHDRNGGRHGDLRRGDRGIGGGPTVGYVGAAPRSDASRIQRDWWG